MKKLNMKGFTLIELLAVITIMGVLMMVAIPSVSRTIENSRRDTFANVTKEYVNAVRNGVLADNIACDMDGNNSFETVASAVPDGDYYFSVDTTSDGTKDLMESGGKSPFGNSEINGYVRWKKTTDDTTNPQNPKTTIKYYVYLTDTGKHGFEAETDEHGIKRSSISTKVTNAAPLTPTSGGKKCGIA